MYNQIDSIEFHISGTKDSPVTEKKAETQWEYFCNSDLVKSVDMLMDIENNKASFLLVFTRPLSFREVADLA